MLFKLAVSPITHVLILTTQGFNHKMVIILVNLNGGPRNENVAGIRSKDEAE
jgi:hypothetical protein